MKKNLFKLTAMALAAGLVFTTGYGLVQASDSYIPKQTPTDNTIDASTGKVKDMDVDVLKTNTKSTTSATSSITLEFEVEPFENDRDDCNDRWDDDCDDRWDDDCDDRWDDNWDDHHDDDHHDDDLHDDDHHDDGHHNDDCWDD